VTLQAAIAFAGAAVASAFAARLALSHAVRPRPHVAAWSAAMAMYAAATWALFAGLAFGWGEVAFRLFYWLGAIVTVVFLALGAAYLVLGSRAGGALLVVFGAFAAGSGAATFGARLTAPLPATGVPAGSEVFAFSGGLASPRLWALVGNVTGTLLLVGLAVYTVVRFRRTDRRLVTGNLLIVAGTAAPAVGGSLTALGEGGGLASSLLVGAGLLWAGYRVAGGARREDAPARAAHGADPARLGAVGDDHPGEDQ